MSNTNNEPTTTKSSDNQIWPPEPEGVEKPQSEQSPTWTKPASSAPAKWAILVVAALAPVISWIIFAIFFTITNIKIPYQLPTIFTTQSVIVYTLGCFANPVDIAGYLPWLCLAASVYHRNPKLAAALCLGVTIVLANMAWSICRFEQELNIR